MDARAEQWGEQENKIGNGFTRRLQNGKWTSSC